MKSLGYRTDLLFHRYGAIVEDRGDYLVVKTPSNPRFHWGNFLLFSEPPKAGSLEKWRGFFQKEFGDNPDVEHMTFGWDNTDGEMGASEEFFAAGFTPERQVVLATSRVNPPPHLNSDVTVRPLKSDREWAAATESQILNREPIYRYDSYKIYKESQMQRYRSMSHDGLGHWFGAFIDEMLVASLGIYKDETLGRFQNVSTNPEFRRKGICGTLVYQAARFAFERWGLTDLVMVADDDGAARRVYESVGFRPREMQSGVSWFKAHVTP